MDYKGSKAEKHSKMCRSTQTALSNCFKQADTTDKFPEACTDLAVSHLECAFAKREYAYETAVQLVGKDAVEKVMPKYQESKERALEMIELYKSNGGKTAEGSFWG